MFFVNILEHTQYFQKRIFGMGSFLIENRIILKEFFVHFFFQNHFFLRNFQRFFIDFSVNFQHFLKRVSVLKFSLTATEYQYHAYKSIKLMTIIEAKIGLNGRRSKFATLFLIESNFDLHRLQSY